MQVPILNLKAQYAQIGTELETALLEVLRSGHYILGDKGVKLEESVAKMSGCKYGIGCANGTDALILALWSLDIGPGDEVITTPFTFAATVEAIRLRGAKAVFVDSHYDSYNIDPSLIEAAITAKTKAILPVHLYGQAAHMEPILAIAKKHNLKVIEDNAQAIGGTYKGKATGSMGDVACISFYPTKNLGACGDAGMLVTNDEKIASRLKVLRAHGMHRRYYHDELGVNSRLDEMQAAALLVKVPYLEAWTERRRQIAELYSRQLKGCSGIGIPEISLAGVPQSAGVLSSVAHVWHQYTIRVSAGLKSKDQTKAASGRDLLVEELNARGVGSMCYYPVPLHMQKAFSDLGYKLGDFPVSELLASQVLSLPMYPELTDEEVIYVASTIKAIVNSHAASSNFAQDICLNPVPTATPAIS